MASSSGEVLELTAEGIVKRFGDFVALDNVSLDLRVGEVLGVVGQNGSGKSTLMKVLIGAQKPDAGRIQLRGRPFSPKNPHDAESQGISMVYQDGALVPDLKVYQYVYLGREVTRGTILHSRGMRDKTSELLENLKIPCSSDDFIRDLSPATQRMVSIAKASLGMITGENKSDERIIILDEPTAQLSSTERSIVFDKVREWKKRVSFVIISHLLQELIEISDRMTVIRDGKNVGTLDLHEKSVSAAELHKLIMGRERRDIVVRRNASLTKVLEVELAKQRVFDVSFSLGEGEIVGFYGTIGSGVRELGMALIGSLRIDRGVLKKGGKSLGGSIAARVRMGIGYLTGDHASQLNIEWSVQRNISLSNWDKILTRFLKLAMIDSRKERQLAEEYMKLTNIAPPNPDAICMSLSGGNKQKVILARWLAKEPDILVLDNPTAGVDVGTREEFYRLLANSAASGKSFILISEDLDELSTLCSKLHLMKDGKIVRSLASAALENLGDEDIRQIIKGL
ncbi:sugar ABC transporter ATP-binding protein [Candidatus Bathyarchaeota archaeon]|nr:MAG: sugar ABC transporter ATP-binding protein [Candidatus Bathyarchaeota archaeon]